jgi:hypothetical protein
MATQRLLLVFLSVVLLLSLVLGGGGGGAAAAAAAAVRRQEEQEDDEQLLLVTEHEAHATPLLLVETSSPSSAEILRNCSLEECFASHCNAEIAPFTCLFHNGGPHGGCSTIPWTVPETCTEQCDLTICKDLSIPISSTTPTCQDVICDVNWCTMDSNGQLCPHDKTNEIPYQCTNGSAKFGCSDDPYQWTLRTDDTTCHTCCDTRTCRL